MGEKGDGWRVGKGVGEAIAPIEKREGAAEGKIGFLCWKNISFSVGQEPGLWYHVVKVTDTWHLTL